MSRCRWDLEPQSRFRGSGRPTGTHLSAFAGPPLIWTTLGKSKFHSFPLYSVYCMFTYSTPSRPAVTLSVIFGKYSENQSYTLYQCTYNVYFMPSRFEVTLWVIFEETWLARYRQKNILQRLLVRLRISWSWCAVVFTFPFPLYIFYDEETKTKSFKKFNIKELRLRGYHDSPIQAQRWTNRKLRISKFLSNNFYTWDALPYKRRRSLRQFDNR